MNLSVLREMLKSAASSAYVAALERRYGFHARRSRRPGTVRERRAVPVIVSMTSIPPRFHHTHLAVETLLRQSCRPDAVILWLGESARSHVPDVLWALQSRGLQIRFERDIGPHTKEIYALRDYPQGIVVTADDDLLYPTWWLDALYRAHEREPDVIHCHMAREMRTDADGSLRPYAEWPTEHGIRDKSMALFPLTGHGVLYPPGSLHPDVLDEERFMALTPKNDDIWLKAMSMRQGTLSRVLTPDAKGIYTIRNSQAVNLIRENKFRNDTYLKDIFEYYGLHPARRT